jgi:hypothetical protein
MQKMTSCQNTFLRSLGKSLIHYILPFFSSKPRGSLVCSGAPVENHCRMQLEYSRLKVSTTPDYSETDESSHRPHSLCV